MRQYLYKPNVEDRDYNFVMAYPSKEEFALSSLGYMWLYKIADTTKGINASRISVDSAKLPMREVKSIAFSMSFDFDFMGVFEILEKNKIPLLSGERGGEHPLIFAGGPVVTTNPRPYDKIFDFMIIGDGEDTFPKVLDIIKTGEAKEGLLNKLSQLDGVYVPNISIKVKNTFIKIFRINRAKSGNNKMLRLYIFSKERFL